MRRLIVESQLFFPAPRFFNDPLDFKITPTFDASAEIIEAHWNEVFERLGMPKDKRPVAVKQRMLEASTSDWQSTAGADAEGSMGGPRPTFLFGD